MRVSGAAVGARSECGRHVLPALCGPRHVAAPASGDRHRRAVESLGGPDRGAPVLARRRRRPTRPRGAAASCGGSTWRPGATATLRGITRAVDGRPHPLCGPCRRRVAMRCATLRAIRPGPWASPAPAGIGTWPCRSVSPWTGTARPDRALCRRGGTSGRRAGGPRRVRTAADPRGVLCRAASSCTGPPAMARRCWRRRWQRKPRRTSRSSAGRRSSPRWVGESEVRLRQVFARARAHQPAVILVDELDALTGRRDTLDQHHQAQLVAQLLVLLDGLDAQGQVVVLETTTRRSGAELAALCRAAGGGGHHCARWRRDQPAGAVRVQRGDVQVALAAPRQTRAAP